MMFSVVIPAYNREDLIGRTIDSVLAQAYTDYEVVVVDDGSTDGTPEVLAGYGDRIRVITQENKYEGAARNTGIRHARGDYIVWLDSDDLWFPWTLATFAAAVARYDRPAWIQGKSREFTDDAELADEQGGELQADRHDSIYAASGLKITAISAAAVRRDVALASPGFNEDRLNGQDVDFMMSCGTADGFVRINAPATFGYRQHAGSILAINPDLSEKGFHYIIDREREGMYPGGEPLAVARREIICRLARGVIDGLVINGHFAAAWRLYRRTLWWQLRQGRLKFVLGIVAYALLRAVAPQRAMRMRLRPTA